MELRKLAFSTSLYKNSAMNMNVILKDETKPIINSLKFLATFKDEATDGFLWLKQHMLN